MMEDHADFNKGQRKVCHECCLVSRGRLNSFDGFEVRRVAESMMKIERNSGMRSIRMRPFVGVVNWAEASRRT